MRQSSDSDATLAEILGAIRPQLMEHLAAARYQPSALAGCQVIVRLIAPTPVSLQHLATSLPAPLRVLAPLGHVPGEPTPDLTATLHEAALVTADLDRPLPEDFRVLSPAQGWHLGIGFALAVPLEASFEAGWEVLIQTLRQLPPGIMHGGSGIFDTDDDADLPDSAV